MQKSAGFLAIAVSMMLMHPVEGWGRLQQEEKEVCCGETPHPMRVTARHIEANGIGYNQGYTTVEGFFPLYNGYDSWICFLDARAHVFNDGQPAANGGLGFRFLTDSYVWGANLYYDYRKTSRQHYNQAAAGLEWLGEQWDVRLNGYLPVGEKRSHLYGTKFDKFKGHEAILRSKYQYVLAGANAEVGYHVNCWKDYPLYLTVGPYYLTGKGGTAWGGQFRARVQIYDYLTIEGNTSYDNLFKWIGQGQVGVTVPFGPRKTVKKNKCQSDCSKPLALAARFYQPVDRLEIVPVDTKQKTSVAIDPLTGDPWFFIFVNNTSHSAGTFESPYPTLAEAEANSVPHNIIYIYPGDQTTTGMDQGITLQDYQKLWGSSVAQTLPTTRGKVTVPQMSNGTFIGDIILPSITNTGDVVTLANNNEISGLFLQNLNTTNCIGGNNITNLSVLNSTLAGINNSGNIGINGTEITGTVNVSGCTFNQNANAVFIQSSTGDITLNLFNNQIDSNFSSAVNLQLTNGITGTLIAENNTIVAGGTGIEVDFSDTTTIRAEINNNQITTQSDGVLINVETFGESVVDVTLQNNTINTSGQSVYLTQTGSLSAVLSGNTLISNSYPLELDSFQGSGDATLLFENNTMSSNEFYVYFNQTAGNITATFNNNLLETGIFSSIGSGNHTLIARGNTMRGNFYSFLADLTDGSFTGTYTNNTISAVPTGITLNQTAGASTLTMTGNTISAMGVGVEISQTAGSLSATITDNTISAYNEFAEAIYIPQTAGPLTVTINNNIINAYTGIYIPMNTGPFTGTFAGNTINGYYPIYLTQATGPFTATINNNTLSAYYGIYLSQTTGPFTTTINNNAISSIVQGISVNLGTGAATAIINNNTVENIGSFSTNAAVFLGGSAGSDISMSMTGNTLIGGSTSYGILVETSSISNNFSIVDNVIKGSNLPMSFTFTNVAATLDIRGNTVQAIGAVSFVVTDGTLSAAIRGNTFESIGNGNNAFFLSSDFVTTTPNVTLDLSENILISAGADAVFLQNMLQTNITANIANNTINSTNFAVTADFGSGAHLINLQSNTVPDGGGFNLILTGGTATWNVIGNNFAALNSSPVSAMVSGGTACMTLNNNTAYPFPNAYSLTQTGGTFILNPPQNNIGDIVPTGTITPGPCP